MLYFTILDNLEHRPEGFTITKQGELLTDIDGYVVGGRTASLKLPLIHFTNDASEEANNARVLLVQWLKRLPDDIKYLGAWKQDDHIYVDTCDILDHLDEAMELAHNRGELAVYNGYEDRVEYVEYEEAYS